MTNKHMIYKLDNFNQIEVTWSKFNWSFQTSITISNHKEWLKFKKLVKKLNLEIINIEQKQREI